MGQRVNLFLVGAMKAGTTSFSELLSQHEEIYASPIKEPHYFVDELPVNLYEPSRFFDLEQYFEKNFPEPLHITNINTESQYELAYSLAGEQKYRLDSSTAYLSAPGVASRIKAYNPDATIVVLLRDPLKRAFSHYKMDVGKGRINKTFESCLQDEITQSKLHALPWHSYLGMSSYKASIESFKKEFSKVIVIHLEDLKDQPKTTLESLASYLDISDFEQETLVHKNVARKPKYGRLFYVLKKMGLKDYFSRLFSNTFKQWIFRATSKEDAFEMKLSPDLKAELNRFFKEHSTL